MTINKQKQENLLERATAYSRRMLLSVQGLQFRAQAIDQIFVGVRPDQRWSLYFDQSPVLQFNRQLQLRRLFILPDKFAALDGRLQKLDRATSGGRVVLDREFVSDEYQQIVLTDLAELLGRTFDLLSQPKEQAGFRIDGKFPVDDVGIQVELVDLLDNVRHRLDIAGGPN